MAHSSVFKNAFQAQLLCGVALGGRDPKLASLEITQMDDAPSSASRLRSGAQPSVSALD
jgi:hypothetical protein